MSPHQPFEEIISKPAFLATVVSFRELAISFATAGCIWSRSPSLFGILGQAVLNCRPVWSTPLVTRLIRHSLKSWRTWSSICVLLDLYSFITSAHWFFPWVVSIIYESDPPITWILRESNSSILAYANLRRSTGHVSSQIPPYPLLIILSKSVPPKQKLTTDCIKLSRYLIDITNKYSLPS